LRYLRSEMSAKVIAIIAISSLVDLLSFHLQSLILGGKGGKDNCKFFFYATVGRRRRTM
jgi:hypothetical protein